MNHLRRSQSISLEAVTPCCRCPVVPFLNIRLAFTRLHCKYMRSMRFYSSDVVKKSCSNLKIHHVGSSVAPVFLLYSAEMEEILYF